MTVLNTPGGSMFSILGILIFFGVLFYFMTIRPMKKQMKEQQDLMATLEPGTRVMLTSGVFGTIKFMGDRQAVVELAPEIEITIVKEAIRNTVDPDDEEFEYDFSPAEESVGDEDIRDDDTDAEFNQIVQGIESDLSHDKDQDK